MNAPDRDIDRFVFVHAAYVVAERDLGRSLDDDPVLGAMEVLLQREFASWLHDDALDPVARGRIDILVISPGTIDAAMLDRGAMVVRLELFDQCLDLLRLRARTYQHGVGGRHYDHVVEPHHGGEHRFLGTHEAVVAVEHDNRALDGVAGGIMVQDVPDGTPTADI